MKKSNREQEQEQEQKRKPRRLKLSRETIKHLDDLSLFQFVRGGLLVSSMKASCDLC